MSETRGLLILDFGGHARSVADIAYAAGVRDFLFVDPNAREGERFLGFPVLKQWSGALEAGWKVFPASGDNARRRQQCEYILSRGWPLATVIAPNATIGLGCEIADGCLIAHHAHVGPMARIGIGCIINTSAVVDHESIVGDYSHVSVNATVAGRCKVGRLSMIGAGATVIDGVEVGDEVTIGAGAVVHRSIGAAGVYAGVPARKL